ncbi:cytochrome d ubiquinol oxidase subunit II [Sporomusa malonica]|uniref:Cytochrome bd-I ubiquinol oxidase subunit 2 apoprotein n=1 Tax=Sporomusa malonica TaxID=112901 RepID=A0A1W1ZLX9_9FIRM|nr:cytochrome d ubiquinol oxidase subunit II [Sporomusa malonica]SMC49394.1 cytochrome bd-I ubiquinol oxidase subunit 2 apoprotein [Sporomusa malonica]
MDLNTICFLMFGFLFIGYLVLEGFDYGVGMILPFLGKSDTERQAIINTLAPVWEGNEVWLIAAGAVLFAGFPQVYATLFSGLYLALLLIVSSLIFRGVAFEFRNKDINHNWRKFWEWAIFFGGVIPALLWGIAVTNLLTGLPINGEMQYSGTFWDLLNPYTLFGGLAFVFAFLLHGAVYLTLRLDQQLILRTRKMGLITGKYAMYIVVVFAILTFVYTDLTSKPIASGILVASVLTLILCYRCLRDREYTKSFVCSTVAIFSMIAAMFVGLFPRFIVSSLDPNWSLTIYNSASNPLTLKIMTVTMAIVLPVVLVFEGWKYYIFRQRICVTEIGFKSRIKLWEQLHDKLEELNKYYRITTIVLEKAKSTVERGGSIQLDEMKHGSVTRQIFEFKALIQRGRQLMYIIAEKIKILRKS